jgi:hypothetical protein
MSFLKEQINHENKSAVNKRFQLQIDAIRSAEIEKVESIILKKKVLLKNSKELHVSDRCLQSLRLRIGAAAANSKIFLRIKKQKRTLLLQYMRQETKVR